MIDVMQKSATPLLPAPGIPRRLACMLYEALLLLAVLFIAAFAFTALARTPLAPHIKPFYQAYLLLVMAGYFVWFWMHGQTLAMKTWRLRLVNRDGGTVSFGQACARFVLALIGIGALGCSVWWAAFDRDKQFLHDRLAGTRIISSDA